MWYEWQSRALPFKLCAIFLPIAQAISEWIIKAAVAGEILNDNDPHESWCCWVQARSSRLATPKEKELFTLAVFPFENEKLSEEMKTSCQSRPNVDARRILKLSRLEPFNVKLLLAVLKGYRVDLEKSFKSVSSEEKAFRLKCFVSIKSELNWKGIPPKNKFTSGLRSVSCWVGKDCFRMFKIGSMPDWENLSVELNPDYVNSRKS